MIKPSPYEIQCNHCSWSKTFAPQSDALIPGKDHVDVCPKCGSSSFSRKQVRPLKGALAEMLERIIR